MDRFGIFVFVGIAVFSIAAALPVALPLLENFMGSMKFMPKGY